MAFGLLERCLRFRQNLTQRYRGCFRKAIALVGKLSADPDAQGKEGEQDVKGGLESAPISEHTGHIQVESHKHRQEQQHGSAENHHGRHLIQPFVQL